MDSITSLHNAARAYCIKRIAKWHESYAALCTAGRNLVTSPGGISTYSSEAFDIFPRYNILAAILSDIEHFTPSDFSSVNALHETLTVAAKTAQSPFQKGEQNTTALAAMEEERQLFLTYIASDRTDKFSSVPLLPFRRVLGDEEHQKLHEAFNQRWGKWYGGSVEPSAVMPPHATIHTQAMEDRNAYESIHRILASKGLKRMFELREWGDGCEVDLENANFLYTGAEGFWTSGDMTWMIYASHESSITFGGDWLIEAMKAVLPLFNRYIYKGWALEAYE